MDSAGVYLRVSSEEQASEGHVSLAVQRQRCAEYAERFSWPVVEVYSESESAFSTEIRPVFERLVIDALAGRFQHVIVFNASRFSRRAAETLTVVERLRRGGVTVHSTSEDLANFLMVGIQAVINEVESRRISERVKPAFQHMAERGLWPRGHPRPAGFQFAPDRVLRHDAVEAPVVRSLFERYAKGESLSQLATWQRTRGHSPCTVTGVRFLLRNPLYAGLIHWNGKTYPGQHAPIVDPALWERVQEMLTGRYQHQQPAILEYAVAGLLTCGRCGARLGIKRRRHSYDVFFCHNEACTSMHVPALQADAAVRAAVAQLTAAPGALDVLVAEAEAQHNARTGSHAQQRGQLQRAATTARRRAGRLLELLLDGTVSREIYLTQQPQLEETAAAAERELAALPAPVRFDGAPLRSAVARMPALLASGAPAAVHEALRLFLVRVEAHVPRGHVRWRDDRLRMVWAGTERTPPCL